MSLIVVGGYKNTDVKNPRGGYQEQFVIPVGTPNHKNGHSVRPNMVVLKYLDFKKDVDLNAHVRVFNFVMKANAETPKKYIINVFSYMLRNITLNWCHNYMSNIHGVEKHEVRGD
jgi:hypothetical protein